MQLVSQGPDLPNELLQSAEEGRLVFFCGAGVSLGVGLPTFEGLINAIYQRLGEAIQDRPPDEQRAHADNRYDESVKLLEKRFGRDHVRTLVTNILTISQTEPDLSTHRALLDLSRGPHGQTQLVTTNFDTAFDLARESHTSSHVAPQLPVPKPSNWSGIVYLHGTSWANPPDSPSSMILSTSDFGRAYLTERWASRFITELFQHYDILFVGYGVNDPVMRYLLDAIEADRQSVSGIGTAFALAPLSDDADRTATEERWRTKGVEPILYPNYDAHSRMHVTLHTWAERHKLGLLGKEQAIHRLAGYTPTGPDDPVAQEVVWALRDSRGSPGKAFAEHNPVPDPVWLPILSRAGLLQTPTSSQYPSTYESSHFVSSAGEHTQIESGPWDSIREQLANWLVTLLLTERTQVGTLRWIAKNGGRLHPRIRRKLTLELSQRSESHPAIIRSLAIGVPGPPSRSDLDAFQFQDLLRDRTLDLWDAYHFCELLTPAFSVIDFSSWRTVNAHLSPESSSHEVQGVDDFGLEATIGPFHGIDRLLDCLSCANPPGTVSHFIASHLQASIWRVLEIRAAFYREPDDSFVVRPSISDHDQNRRPESWSALIVALRITLELLYRRDAAAAREWVRSWSLSDYPVFWRLAICLATQTVDSAPRFLLDVLIKEKRIIWKTSVGPESWDLIQWLWRYGNTSVRSELLKQILDGPGRSEETNPDTADHMVRRRLALIYEIDGHTWAGSPIPVLRSTACHYSGIDRPVEEFEKFRVYLGDSQSMPLDHEYEHDSDWCSNEPDQAIAELQQTSDPTRLRQWIETVNNCPGHAGRIFEQYISEHEPDVELLDSTFVTLSQDANLDDAFGTVRLLQGPVRLTQYRSVLIVARWLESNCGREKIDTDETFFRIWDQLAASIPDYPINLDTDDALGVAINAPDGVLAEALLDRAIKVGVQRDGGLPSNEYYERLADCIAPSSPRRLLARVAIARQLSTLHAIDRTWTQQKLVPWFEWPDDPNGVGCWSAFLHGPRVSPDLATDLRDALAKASENSGKFTPFWQTRLGEVLSIIATFGDEGVAESELRKWLKQATQYVRRGFADRLTTSVRPENGEGLWNAYGCRIIADIWPRDLHFQDEFTSEKLVELAIRAGRNANEALQVVQPLIVPLENTSMIWDEIADSGIASSWPDAAIRLTRSLCSNRQYKSVRDPALERILEQAQAASPNVREMKEFKEIQEAIRTIQ